MKIQLWTLDVTFYLCFTLPSTNNPPIWCMVGIGLPYTPNKVAGTSVDVISLFWIRGGCHFAASSVLLAGGYTGSISLKAGTSINFHKFPRPIIFQAIQQSINKIHNYLQFWNGFIKIHLESNFRNTLQNQQLVNSPKTGRQNIFQSIFPAPWDLAKTIQMRIYNQSWLMAEQKTWP